MNKLKEHEWHGMCKEWYSLKADVRELKGKVPSYYPPEKIELAYVEFMSKIISDALNELHYEYAEKGKILICSPYYGTSWYRGIYVTVKKVPPDAQVNFSYVGNISYFYICNKAIIELTLDEMIDNDIKFLLTIIAPCYIVRDFLKHLLFKASQEGILVV
jgi:hypothetical protein